MTDQGMMGEFIPWLYTLAFIAVGLAMLGAGVAFVRRAHPGAGYVLAAAGGILSLSACCMRGFMLWNDDPTQHLAPAATAMVVALGRYGCTFLALILAAVSIAMLANKLKANKKAPPPPPAVF